VRRKTLVQLVCVTASLVGLAWRWAVLAGTWQRHPAWVAALAMLMLSAGPIGDGRAALWSSCASLGLGFASRSRGRSMLNLILPGSRARC